MTSTERLPSDYVQARARFLAAARERGAEVSHHDHPLQGPGSELLATDVARFGRADAPARLLVISGTHGIEGFAGSACQSAWLESGDLPARDGDVGIVVVHAINPFGFAWLRRVNEDNVDLNRNVVDFASPPENQGYDALADAIVPRRFDDPAVRASADETLLAFAAEHGFDALQDAVSRGQYRHPHGVFYGGTTAVWSQRTLEAIVRRHLTGAERVGVIDLHTGLGPFGYGEVMASHPDAAGKARLASWYGDGFTIPAEGTSVSADVQGDVLDGIESWLPGTDVTGIAIEWGTVDIVEVSNALRADAWLHAHANPRGPEAVEVKDALRAAFAPDDPAWLQLVLDRFTEVKALATAGLVA